MTVEALSPTDPCSHSNPEQCKISDMHLNLQVDFKRQILFGYVDLSVIKVDPKAESLILDVQDLNIQEVKDKDTMKDVQYTIDEPIPPFGCKCDIKLPKTSDKKFIIRICYETKPQSGALQWLKPSQTLGKKHPYLLSQCQAILARSLVPCQDTPAVKFSYTASIVAPADLVVLMSAIRNGEEVLGDSNLKVFKFVQKIPIPSYLLVLAVGALKNRKIGPRSYIWCEEELIEKAAYEFAEIELMLKTAENFMGPYVWEVYDILVMPPSFPYGGMENPCLTFLTPTIIVGDRSSTSVVVHEICHSWTGNLVTSKNWEHFWLNEGFTMFLERKIVGKMKGDPHRHFMANLGWKNLKYDISVLGNDNPVTNLVPTLNGISPDDIFSFVPYEKGHTFLFYLENLLGGSDVFDDFLRAYVEKFKHQSITTDDFKSFLYEYFADKKDILNSVDWNKWLYAPGLPPEPSFDMSLSNTCINLCQKWVNAGSDLSEFKKEDIQDMSSLQIEQFLALLLQEKPLSLEKMAKLTELYGFENNLNAEIRFSWLRLGLKCHWKPIIPHTFTFVTKLGRRKYIERIYRDLYEWEETRESAISAFKEHSNELMHVSTVQIANILHLNAEK